MEIKIIIEAPELAASLNNLASAISHLGEIRVHPGVTAPPAHDNKPVIAAVPDARVEQISTNPQSGTEIPVSKDVSNPSETVAPAPVPAQAQVPSPAPTVNPIPAVQQSVIAAPVTSVSQTVPPVTTGSPATEQPQPRQYTMQDIAKVGSALLDKGMMPQLSAILKEMGVQAIPQLREDQYPIVAEKLIALGGKFE